MSPTGALSPASPRPAPPHHPSPVLFFHLFRSLCLSSLPSGLCPPASVPSSCFGHEHQACPYALSLQRPSDGRIQAPVPHVLCEAVPRVVRTGEQKPVARDLGAPVAREALCRTPPCQGLAQHDSGSTETRRDRQLLPACILRGPRSGEGERDPLCWEAPPPPSRVLSKVWNWNGLRPSPHFSCSSG